MIMASELSMIFFTKNAIVKQKYQLKPLLLHFEIKKYKRWLYNAE